MKKNELKQLVTKSKEELYTLVNQYKGEIAKLTVYQNSGKAKKGTTISQKKKDLARILTIIREKEIASI